MKWTELKIGKPYKIIRNGYESGMGYLVHIDNPKVYGMCPLQFKLSDYLAKNRLYYWADYEDEFEEISENVVKKFAAEMDVVIKVINQEFKKDEVKLTNFPYEQLTLF